MSLCPKCGINQEAIREMLTDSPGEHQTARVVIDNCPECRRAFGSWRSSPGGGDPSLQEPRFTAWPSPGQEKPTTCPPAPPFEGDGLNG